MNAAQPRAGTSPAPTDITRVEVLKRILVLDGHTNQALACVRALGEAGYEVLVASDRRSPLGGWSRHCRGRFRLSGQNVEAFAAMREWARGRGVRIVLPLTERSCVLLNAARAQWEAAGMTLGCATDDLLAAAFDKSRTVERARACGVSTPPTRAPASLAECADAAEEFGFPCVVKPRRSNHWDGVRFLPTRGPAYVGSREELAEAAESLRQGADWPLIQGYVSGKGKGVFALCDGGRAVAWFAHERLRDTRPSGAASSLRRSIALDARLREPAERLLRELKWHGPAMVEFKDDGANPPCLIEINGRFWGSLQLAIDAGVNFPLLWVSLLEGRPVEPQTQYREGVTLRWIWGDAKRFVRILRGAPPGYPGAYPSVLQGVRELLGPQPRGTRLEVWRRRDLWPGVGEWAGALEEAILRRKHWRARRTGRANGVQGRPAALPAGSNSLSHPMSIEMNSNVVIREARPEEILNWDDLVTRFDNYRVVHKLAWMRSLEACVKGKPLYLVYEKGGEIVGCLPGFLATVGFLRLFGSPLPGWQTLSMGPVFDRRRITTRELVSALLPFLQKRHGVQHVELIGADFDHETMKEMRFQSKPAPSYCTRLFPGDEGRVMRSLKESARRNVRRADKLGLVVKFEDDESFIDEHYDQLREVYARGGNVIPFSKKRALEFFRHMKAGGNLLAVSVSLPDGGPCIATGTFTIEGRELLLWMWAHRTQYRWYRPTELMTWTVMKRAMERGCDTFDLMGRGEFKTKFGAELNENKYRWVWSRYDWLLEARLLAEKSYRWQQGLRGRVARQALFSRLSRSGQMDGPVSAGGFEAGSRAHSIHAGAATNQPAG